MTEKELISKISQLREIKPRQDWVVFTKRQVLGDYQKKGFGEELREGFGLIFQSLRYKPALAAIVFFGIIISVFGLAQNTLPGDSLYPLKKITEKGQGLLAGNNQSKLVFEVANRRSDELNAVAKANLTKNLAPAIQEYKDSVSEVAKSLANEAKNKGKITKEMVAGVKNLEEKRAKIETMGVEIGDNKELDNAIAQLVESEIKDLETRTLTEEQNNTLLEIRSDYEAGDCTQALEKILLINSQ